MCQILFQTDYQHPTSVWMVELEYHVYIDHIILHIGTSRMLWQVPNPDVSKPSISRFEK